VQSTNCMLNTMKDAIYDFGCATGGAAKRFGRRTADIAEDIGPKRGLIGLAILGAAIGGTFYLVRYVRARRAEQLVEIQPTGEVGEQPVSRREKRKSMHAHTH
jgi:hypothetical protein